MRPAGCNPDAVRGDVVSQPAGQAQRVMAHEQRHHGETKSVGIEIPTSDEVNQAFVHSQTTPGAPLFCCPHVWHREVCSVVPRCLLPTFTSRRCKATTASMRRISVRDGLLRTVVAGDGDRRLSAPLTLRPHPGRHRDQASSERLPIPGRRTCRIARHGVAKSLVLPDFHRGQH